jgi:hypothetical protein
VPAPLMAREGKFLDDGYRILDEYKIVAFRAIDGIEFNCLYDAFAIDNCLNANPDTQWLNDTNIRLCVQQRCITTVNDPELFTCLGKAELYSSS